MKITGPSLKAFFAITVLCLLFASLLVPARGNQEENNQDLADLANQVVIGKVAQMKSQWNNNRTMIYSYVKITVEQVLKGAYQTEVTARCLGGEVEDIGIGVSSEPTFNVGERVKLYLKFEETGNFALVGGVRGKISLTGGASSTGYSYSGVHWSDGALPVKYYINQVGTPDTENEFMAVQRSFQTWEDDPGSYMDYTYMGTTSAGAETRDSLNVIAWGSIDGPGNILARTTYRYSVLGKHLFEFDIVFDEEETWSSSGEPNKFDVQSVCAHEAGHTLVLNDLYNAADKEETMYGYISLGEVKKRDLYSGDIAGIRYIYPIRTIDIDTDKGSYKSGETAKISGHIVNPGPAINVRVKVWAQLPDASVMNIMDKLTTIPTTTDATRTVEYTFPSDAQQGAYALHVQLIDPSTQQIIDEDTATFTLSY